MVAHITRSGGKMAEDTDEFLAVRFPNVPKSFLAGLNKRLAWLKVLNGGHAEMKVRWSGGKPQWTDWTDREMAPKQAE